MRPGTDARYGVLWDTFKGERAVKNRTFKRCAGAAFHGPGETVPASADGQAPFVVLVYVNDVMVKQILVPAQ